MKLRALALGAAVLAAVPFVSGSVEASPWGWRGVGWHGGLGPRWNEGGWGLGGVGYGLAAGVIIGNAIVTPYGYFNGGYYDAYYPGDYYGYGYAPAVTYAYASAVTYGSGYGYGYRRYGYGYGLRPGYRYGGGYGGYRHVAHYGYRR